MKNITQESNWVRVIGNTHSPDIPGMNEMIGKEYEVDNSNYADDTICVWKRKNNSVSFCFNKSDVRFLTAGMHNKRSIARGDEVLVDDGWEKVLGVYMYNNSVKIQTGTLENTISYLESQIEDHRTEASLSGKQVTVTIDGKDYQAIIK